MDALSLGDRKERAVDLNTNHDPAHNLEDALKHKMLVVIIRELLKPPHYFKRVSDARMYRLVCRSIDNIICLSSNMSFLGEVFGLFHHSQTVAWKYAVHHPLRRSQIDVFAHREDACELALGFARVIFQRLDPSVKRVVRLCNVDLRVMHRKLLAIEAGLLHRSERKPALRVLSRTMRAIAQYSVAQPTTSKLLSFCAVSMWSYVARSTRSGVGEAIAEAFLSILSTPLCAPGTVARQVVLDMVLATCFATQDFMFQSLTQRSMLWSTCISLLPTYTSSFDMKCIDENGYVQIQNETIGFPHDERRIVALVQHPFFAAYIGTNVYFAAHLVTRVYPTLDDSFDQDVIRQVYITQLHIALTHVGEVVARQNISLCLLDRYFAGASALAWKMWDQEDANNAQALFQPFVYYTSRHTLHSSRVSAAPDYSSDQKVLDEFIMNVAVDSRTRDVPSCSDKWNRGLSRMIYPLAPGNLDHRTNIMNTIVQSLLGAARRHVTRVWTPTLQCASRAMTNTRSGLHAPLVNIIHSYLFLSSRLHIVRDQVQSLWDVSKTTGTVYDPTTGEYVDMSSQNAVLQHCLRGLNMLVCECKEAKKRMMTEMQ